MSGYKGSTFCNDFLQLVFKAVGIANIADNASSSPLTNLYFAIHTADPTAGGNATSNECNYTGYARVAVARPAGFTVVGNSVSPAATVSFPACTGGTNSATYFSVTTASSGATKLLYVGPISPTISISNGVTPQLTTASACTES